MDTHTNGFHKPTNGKSSRSLTTIPAPPESQANTDFDRLLMLVKEAINLEMQLKDKMNQIDTEMRGKHTLPTVLRSLVRPEALTQPTRATLEGPGLAKAVPTVWVEDDSIKGRVVAVMADGRERKSGVIIKALKAKNYKSSVYHALKELVEAGFLVKPAYGHYRKA
jgi:hypothetical protein